MSWALLVVLIVLAATVTLFVLEVIPIELVACGAMLMLLVTGILAPSEGFAGFSHPATITVTAMFVVSAALGSSGAIERVVDFLTQAYERSKLVGQLALMLGVAALSAFLNNTPIVAMFIPALSATARRIGISPAQVLIPLSFSSMLGGVCTVIGTSTNVVVSGIAARHGQDPFGMFEMLKLGLIFIAVGVPYLLFAGPRLLPKKIPPGTMTAGFELRDYLAELVVDPQGELVDRAIGEVALFQRLEMEVLQVRRGHLVLPVPAPGTKLGAGDVLLVRCDPRELQELRRSPSLLLKPQRHLADADLQAGEVALVEAVVAPGSSVEGQSIKELDFQQKFDAIAIALRRRRVVMRRGIGRVPLQAGDVLLVEVHRTQLERLSRDPAFVVVSEVRRAGLDVRKALVALTILVALVLSVAFNILAIEVAAAAGAMAMLATRCLTIDEAYRAVEWRVVFLLGGVLSIGRALETTGGARLIARALARNSERMGPMVTLGGLYLLTMVLTEVMSNNATAALLVPIALAAARALSVRPRPLLMAVTFAASASFMTPVGYQTNTMVYGPGHYRFVDFTRIGAPLNVVLWIAGTLLIPRFWPF